MNLREYERNVMRKDAPDTVDERVSRLAWLLRFVTVEAGKMGYGLEELASRNISEEKNFTW